MSPKEKAKDLFEIYLWETGNETFAKNCSLVAVDEILSDYKNYLLHENTNYKGLMYWKEVKQELEKYDT
jgi:hypothetical protein